MESFIKLVENKLQLNIRAHFKNGSYLMVGAVGGLLSNLAISVAFANLLPPSIFGTYKYIQSLITVVGSFSLTQTNTVITRSVARGFEGAWKEGLIKMLIWSIFPFLIGVFISGYYILQGNLLLATAVAIASLLSPLMTAARLYAPFLNGKQAYAEISRVQILRSIVPTVALVVAAFYFSSLIYLITVFYLSYLVVDTMISFYVYFKHRPSQKTDETDYSLSKHLSFMNLLSVGANHVDKILLFQFVGAVELALYAITTALPKQVTLITSGFKTLLTPKISNQSLMSLKKNIHKRAIQIGFLLLMLALLYILVAPHIFIYLFPKYVDGIFLSQVYAIGVVFTFGMPYRIALTTHSRTKELYYITVSMSIIKIVLTLVFVLQFGLWGAVLSFVISKLIANLLLIVSFYRINDETVKL